MTKYLIPCFIVIKKLSLKMSILRKCSCLNF